MNSTEYTDWCQAMSLTAAAVGVIEEIRTNPPSRRVMGRAGNASGSYPSRKMGKTIQFESHTVELRAIYQMEHDPEVLEFYDQPPPFKIQYQSQSGRKIGHYHTPDFFVLRTDSAGWEEWKTESELLRLEQKYPSRYYRTVDGRWRCPPGETHAEALGLFYRVRCANELHPVFIQNLMFLEDYCVGTAAVSAPIQEQVRELVKASAGISIGMLLNELPSVRANDVYILLAQGQIYADMYAALLREHWLPQLYIDESTYQAHQNLRAELSRQAGIIAPATLVPNTKLLWDGRIWTLVNCGLTTTTLLPEVGAPLQLPSNFFLSLVAAGTIDMAASEATTTTAAQVRELLESAAVAHLKEANRRFHLVQAYQQRCQEVYQDIAPRTLRRWVKQFQAAKVNYGCGYVGLLPKIARRGNRTPKAPAAAKELLDAFIQEHFATPRQAPAASVYRAYQQASAAKNIPALSRSSFYEHLKQSCSLQVREKRLGAKAAYQQQPWVWELAHSTPRHGDRPLAIVHIDHTQLDIELRCSTTGRNLGRPWLTMLIDAYSRRILALHLTFDAPSYRSCMMGLRQLVRHCGRFPQAVVVDGGKEFHSVYFDTLLARYHCLKKTRPGAKPRFGSVIERLFGTTNQEFIYNLLGNTQASKQPRTLTKAVDPKRQAVWTLADLYAYLTEWASVVYDQSEHPALGQTPHAAYTTGLLAAGEREHRCIPYDEEFLMMTRPSTIKGHAVIQPGQGIKVNYIYYWSDAFRNPQVERAQVPVRYDPFDMGVAYAYVQGRWVKCISQYYSIFAGRSEKELLLAAQEIKQQGKLTRSQTSISAKRLADFLSRAQEHEALLVQRWRDLEAQRVMETTAALPSSASKASPIPVAPSTRIEPLLAIAPIEIAQLPVFEEYR